MNIGELVQLKDPIISGGPPGIGLIIDVMEMDDGFFEYEVQFTEERYWFTDLELEVISESR